MTIRLIGAHRTWDGKILSPTQRDRFAASLGIVDGRKAQSSYDGEILLASTGQPRGWRPLTCPDGSRLLFAGHIDNRSELAQDLGIPRDSDEALYAAAFAKWGDAVDLRAIGQFATIIIQPGRKSVRLARSPIMAPPLYYAHDRDKFIAVTFMNAMFATGELERGVDYQTVNDFLLWNVETDEKSYFEGVRKIPCGHRAIATPSGVAISSYYDLASLPEIRLRDDRDYQHAARELLEAGVKAALDGFSRPAIQVSGGFDSQTVAALVAKQRPGEPLQAFTCVPEPGWDGSVMMPEWQFGNERPYAEALADMYPEIKPHWIDAANLNFDHRRMAMFLACGEPGPPLIAHHTHEAYAQAKASGCDLMLDANCGNASFSYCGAGVLPSLARSGKWRKLWREARHLGKTTQRSTLHIIATQALFPHVPHAVHIALAKLLGREDMLDTDPFDTWCIINRDHLQRLRAEGSNVQMKRINRSRLPNSTRIFRMVTMGHEACQSAASLQAFGLLNGMESRDPTSYRPLVEFCFGIPDEQYLRNGEDRWLARRMLKGLVPDMVVSEKRIGMRMPDWFQRIRRQRSELIAQYDRFLEDKSIAAIVDIESIRQELIDFPETAPPVHKDWKLHACLSEAQALGQFIQYVENRNI